MSKITLTTALLFVLSITSFGMAQNAWTGVNVGPGFAGAQAGAQGSIFQFSDTKTRVKNGQSFGQGVAVGVGQNGVSFSHSIGANGGGLGLGHNLNMTIGRNGAHVSQGGVTSQGGNSSVQVGGRTGQGPGRQIYGGSNATGWGNNTRAWSNSRTQQFRPVFFR